MARNLRFATQSELDKYLAGLRSPGTVATDTSSKRGPPKRNSSFWNQKTTDAQGIVHDSKGEQRRWQELQIRERAGEIQRLRRQVPYALVVNGLLICSYVADFDYDEGQAHIVEDHKSKATRKLRDYRIKLKLMQAIHGIQIREV